MLNKKSILILLSLVFLSASCLAKFYKPTDSPYQTPIIVKEQRIFVDVADTKEKMETGLSGREKLKNDEGMLFDFRAKQNKRPSFWMKGMKFGIDIIWIKDSEIIGVTNHISPPANSFERLKTYTPPGDVDYVLEVVAGWTNEFGANAGDKIKIQNY